MKPEDAAAHALVEQFLASRQAELSLARPEALVDLVARWRRFVSEVETGYKLTIYDYSLELDVRDSLQELLSTLPSGGFRRSLTEDLSPLDERLRFATRSSTRGLAPGATAGDRFWWFRVPRRLVGELKADLESENLL